MKNVENMCEKEGATLQKLDEIGGKKHKAQNLAKSYLPFYLSEASGLVCQKQFGLPALTNMAEARQIPMDGMALGHLE